MTDLEITRLCALALHGGFNPVRLGNSETGELVRYECKGEKFDPLHDDAQAMALVKKFHIALGWNPGWAAFRQDTKKWVYAGDGTVNRAICLCVAKMQQAKVAA